MDQMVKPVEANARHFEWDQLFALYRDMKAMQY